jgi:glucosamine--fructose-6-phosphate aminotransferase (isomerizing)
MCGIVGYTGTREAAPILLEGLRRLEYRGYDSAGIATLPSADSDLAIRRAAGKLDNLAKLLADRPLSGRVGIGHTRWATHGVPSERNAHPHRAGPVALVHNGIIENHVELMEELREQGHRFSSDTDSEIVAHLIEGQLKDGVGLAATMRQVITRLRGSFSLVALSRNEPETLVAAKTATPLVIGFGEGENFVASDIPALLEHTRRILVLEDGEVAEITPDAVRVTTIDGKRSTREPRWIDWEAARVGKGSYRHYLRKEIADQPQAWIDTLSGRANLGSGTVQFEERLLPSGGADEIGRLVIVSAGASYIASLIGKFMIEELCGVPVEVDYSAEFRYRSPVIDRNTMLVAVSQSGETADTMAAMEEGKTRGAWTMALTNSIDSSIARRADARLYTRCGPEISVTTTKCFIAQIETFYLFAIHLGLARRSLNPEQAAELLAPAFAIPSRIEAIVGAEREIERIAKKFASATDFLYLGRGINYPVALEGALKLKEISYIHAEGYPAGEMKHGPIALIDEHMPVVVIIPRDAMFEKTLSNLREVESRNGRIIAVTDQRSEDLQAIAEEVIQTPKISRMLTPVLMTIPLQLLAYHIAVYRGTDVDQPRNLAKSVTVE